MRHPQWEILLRWLQGHPGLFAAREEGDDLEVLERFSGKSLRIRGADVVELQERPNTANPMENFVVVLFSSGRQLVLSVQGFAFAPDFANTGPMPLPNQVYCLQDYANLMNRLRHVAAEAERGREALEIIMVLIAILDGARAVGLDVGAEEQAVNDILSKLEKGETLPPPH